LIAPIGGTPGPPPFSSMNSTRFLLLRLFQPYAWFPAVLIDELDAGQL
jgi:hypothetical protein